MSIPGLPNFRDLGGLAAGPSPPPSPTSPAAPGAETTPAGIRPRRRRIIRPGVIFRSAAPSRFTPAGNATLTQLKLATAYDLRSTTEVVAQDGDEAGAAARLPPGVRRVHTPVFQAADYSPEAIAMRYRSYAAEDTTAGFVAAYRAILRSGGPAFGAVLAALAVPHGDDPRPLLVHCTAGKDRTGVLCALILALCSVDDETIAAEYSLTEQALAHWRPEMQERLLQNPALAENPDGVVRMLSARPDSMLATLRMLRAEYGSAEKYALTRCGLSAKSLAQLRRNLIIDAEPMAEDTPSL